MDSGHPFNVTSNDGYNNNDDDDYGVGYNAISEATNTYLSRFWIWVCCLWFLFASGSFILESVQNI